jgi:hypothetical protein
VPRGQRHLDALVATREVRWCVMNTQRLARCALCGEFVVPWGDAIGEAIMRQHQVTDCSRMLQRDPHDEREEV